MRRVRCEECAVRLRGCLRDLTFEQLAEFAKVARPVLYRRRQVIFHETTPATALFILCRGAVKLYHADALGREHILGIAVPGEVLGEIPGGDARPYSVSAEAISDAQLCCLTRQALARVVRLEPMAAVRLIAALSQALAAARRKVRSLALKPAECRMAELLLSLTAANEEHAPGDGHPPLRVDLHYSRREIAEMVGISTETAIRILGRLRDRGIIEVHHRRVDILDLESLARLCGAEEGGSTPDGVVPGGLNRPA